MQEAWDLSSNTTYSSALLRADHIEMHQLCSSVGKSIWFMQPIIDDIDEKKQVQQRGCVRVIGRSEHMYCMTQCPTRQGHRSVAEKVGPISCDVLHDIEMRMKIK